MIGAIMNCISSAILLIIFCLTYVFLITKPLSYFLLSPSYKKHTETDKEVGKYKFPDGRGIVYEPDEEYKAYLEKYVLFTYKNQKYIKCKLSDNVASLKYEIAVFNPKGRLIRVFDLAENIARKGNTQTVALPDDTAYARVSLRSVNDREAFPTLPRTSVAKICTFSIIAIAMTMALGIIARMTIMSVFALLNKQVFIGLGANMALSFFIGALVAFLCLMIHKKQIFGENNG